MIPKVIHYCWFGGKEKPELAQKCINSWKTNCVGYEIKEWNESNFDLSSNAYIREAYQAKKWAFITDYVRLYVLVTEGGIYMDTDVEVIQPLDFFLKYKAFSGFQTDTEIPTGIMACEKGFKLFDELLHDYDNRHFKIGETEYDMTTNVVAITNACLKKGLVLNNKKQDVDGFVLYPKDYFCAKNYITGVIEKTKNTVTIHHFAGSWRPKESVVADKIKVFFGDKNIIVRIVGKFIAAPWIFIARCKIEGTRNSIKYYLKKLEFLAY